MRTDPAAAVAQHLFASLWERRMIVLPGELTNERVSETAASLMALDALGDEHIDLLLNATTGSIEHALSVVDVIQVLGVPVHAKAIGVITGGATGILAAADRRLVAPHTRLHLIELEAAASGRPPELLRFATERNVRRDQFFTLLSERTGMARPMIEHQWDDRPYVDAESAVAMGYADGVAT